MMAYEPSEEKVFGPLRRWRAWKTGVGILPYDNISVAGVDCTNRLAVHEHEMDELFSEIERLIAAAKAREPGPVLNLSEEVRHLTTDEQSVFNSALRRSAQVKSAKPAPVSPDAREIVKKVRDYECRMDGKLFTFFQTVDEAAALIQSAIDAVREEGQELAKSIAADSLKNFNAACQEHKRAEAAERERDALRAQAEKLAEALEPFATLPNAGAHAGARDDTSVVFAFDGHERTVGDFRSARTALAEWKEPRK